MDMVSKKVSPQTEEVHHLMGAETVWTGIIRTRQTQCNF